MLPSSQFKEVNIRDYLVIIKRKVWVILACFVISTTWSTIQTFKKIPLYRASVKVIIERSMPQVAPMQQVFQPYWVDKEYFQSQINIITSRSMAKKAVEALIAGGDISFSGTREPELAFLGGISVNIVPNTQLLAINYTSTNPIKAAKFANALANTYIKEDISRRTEVSTYATGWLQTQLTEMQKKLQESEGALNDYIQQNKIVSTPDIEKKTEGLLQGLKSDKVTIENELSELSKRYKSQHPKIVALNTRLEAVNKGIEEETKTLLLLSEKMMQYNTLKREVESNKSLYGSLLTKAKETEVTKELETTNIRIIDLADVPRAPFSPNRKQDIYRGAMIGALLGFALAFLLEYLDSSIKTADDVEAYVRLPFLGYVPSAKQEAKTEKDIDIISHKIPHSRIAEAYRSIRTSIIFSAPQDRPLRTILVTSASPKEGKTTVSINLGIIFANANEKTLILEADMRKPRISASLEVENREGLSSFLAGTIADMNSAIKQTAIPNLFVIPSGPRPPNPAELLTSAKMKSLLEELRAGFDRIIIDSPPVLTVADTAILANITDGAIDVIRAGFLNIDLILKGRQRLNEAKAKIIGVILNNVNVKKEDSYYYYSYYYAEEKEKKA